MIKVEKTLKISSMSLTLTRLSLRANAGSGLIGNGSSIFRLSIRALSTTKIKQVMMGKSHNIKSFVLKNFSSIKYLIEYKDKNIYI